MNVQVFRNLARAYSQIGDQRENEGPSTRLADFSLAPYTDRSVLYRIEDEEEMRRTFQAMNMSKSRSEWLYSYDPLTVPLAHR